MKKRLMRVLTVILSITVLILSGLLWDSKNQEVPTLVGSYQSETMPPDIFMLSFDRDGQYEVYYNSLLVDEGNFEAVTDSESYIIQSEEQNQLIVLLEKDEFYYYSANNEVYLLKNLDKVPTKINTTD